MYHPPRRPRRASLRNTLFYTPLYRAVLIGVAACCFFVILGVWVVQGRPPARLSRYSFPPGQSYHVNAAGEIAPVGGAKPGGTSVPTPAPHASLLDRTYIITAEFGHYPEGGAHYGLDLDAWTGTLIHAPVGGQVTAVYRGCRVGDQGCGKGWGNHVWFQSAETGHYVLIGHFSEINDWVQEGVTFDAGAPLGLSGSTGYSSGPHVHIQVNPDQIGNPGSTNPAWEFPWLRCGEPVLGAFFGATCP